MSSGLSDRVERGLGTLAVGCFKRPWLTLAVIATVTAAALAGTIGRLSLNADLVELLPESFASVQDLEVLKKRFGGIGYVAVVAHNAPPEALEHFAEDVAPKLEALSTVRYVEYRRPTRFFEDRALYFLDTPDLNKLSESITERVEWEKRQNNPMYLDLEESEPPTIDIAGLQQKYSSRGDTSWVQTQMGEAYYIDRDNRIIALLCKPATLSTDLSFTRELVEQVKGLVDSIDLSQYHPDMQVAYAGNYTKKVDQHEMIISDLALSTSVAVLLILIYLAWHFRRLAAVGLIMGPLVIGLVWAHAFAALTFGALNILTGFIGAILLGLGIDHGIHLLGRFEGEIGDREEHQSAVRRAFGHTGRAVAVAALTTTVGFAGLGLSEFRAFREFGVVPAMLAIVLKLGWRPRHRDAEPQTTWASWAVAHGGKVMIACALLAVPVIYGFRQARFNYNFRALVSSDLPSFRMDSLVDGLLGYSQTPVVVLTNSQEEERQAAAALRDRQDELGDATTIDFVAAGADLIPLDQPAKWEILQSLDKTIAGVKASWLPKDMRSRFALLQRATKIPPFGVEDWPPEVSRQFRGPDGTADDGFVLVFPGVDLSDGANVSAFAKELRGITLPSGQRVAAAGEPMILADIFDMVAREAPRVLSITLVLIFLTMWMLLGSLRHAFLCFVPALLTLIGTIGLLHAMGLELNYINIVMVPVLFGIGVDGGVHLVTRVAQEGGLTATLTETTRAIGGALLTTSFGFGALILADHKGLDSLGELAVLGLAVNLLASLVVLPALLGWRPSLVASDSR